MQNNFSEILIVASWYPSKEQPTYGSFVEEQVQMLVSKGHSVTVLHPELSGSFLSSVGKKTKTVKHEQFNGVSVIRVVTTPVLPKSRTLSYNRLAKVAYNALKTYFQESPPTIIHAHAMFMGGIVAKYLALKTHIPYFLTEHTSGLINSPEQYTAKDISKIKSVSDNAKKVFYVSQFAKDEMIQRYHINPNKSEVLSNMVADSFFLGENKLLKKNPFKYIVIGSLSPRKNIPLLINAFAKVIKSRPNSSLTIAGEGEAKKTLNQLVQRLNIEAKVYWLPQLSRDEVKEQILKHHVLVSASKLETFGLTIAEAVATGTPVVVTDSGGVRDIVTKENGVICIPTLPEISKKLIQSQNEYDQYNHEQIRLQAKERFSEEVIYKQLINYYEI